MGFSDQSDPPKNIIQEIRRMGESRKGVMKAILALVGVTVVLILGTWLAIGSEPRLGPHDGLELSGLDTGRVGIGDVAPDFSLMPLHGDKPVTLSSFVGKRPVALIFGSYT